MGENYDFSSHQVVLETADVISTGKHILGEQTMIDREEFRTSVLLWKCIFYCIETFEGDEASSPAGHPQNLVLTLLVHASSTQT